MPLTTTPVENVVWGCGKEGAGTFTNCYTRYMRAKAYCKAPFDKFKNNNGKIETIDSTGEKISAHFVSSYEELCHTSKSAWLLNGDSSYLSDIPSSCVDFVITDPPYFDNIHYSELSNFFYIWLGLGTQHPYFKAENVPTQQEAIVNLGMGKREQDYERLLSSVFQESARILKDDGKLIFTFHHSKSQAWWTVLNALIHSCFCITSYFPVMSEYKVSPHIRNKQSLDMDIVLICEKKNNITNSLSLSFQEILNRAVKDLSENDNKLFLRFMGELLRTASFAQMPHKISYNWFKESLSHFDAFLKTINRTEKKQEYNMPEMTQLALFG